MPLVAHNELPTFSRLQQNGQEVLTPERARKQDIRELHIGFLNMMPDAALTATEQQFIRLVGGSNQIAQFYVYPFSLPELHRGAKAEEHINQYYFQFGELTDQGLDALIITGANVANPSLDQEAFWEPLGCSDRWGSLYFFEIQATPVQLPIRNRMSCLWSHTTNCRHFRTCSSKGRKS